MVTPHLKALHLVTLERDRQEQLKEAGKFRHTCADSEMKDADAIAALGEEFGEVCKALLERRGASNDLTDSNLQKELVQVAAVAVAWVERLLREHS